MVQFSSPRGNSSVWSIPSLNTLYILRVTEDFPVVRFEEPIADTYMINQLGLLLHLLLTAETVSLRNLSFQRHQNLFDSFANDLS